MLDTQLLMAWLIDDLTRLSADLTAAGPADEREVGLIAGVDEALDIVKIWADRALQVDPATVMRSSMSAPVPGV